MAAPLDKKELRKQFLWLYGVVVGLVIREATIRVVPLFTHPTTPLGWNTAFLFARYFVLMLMVVRFYLGAATVVNYEWEGSATVESEAISLLSGLAHFVLFFAWASTLDIDAGTRSFLNFSEFEVLLLLVLLYDVAWWAMSGGHRFEKLTLWTTLNLGTAVLCVAIHMVLAALMQRWKLIESIVFLPVVFVSLIDISEILTQRELFRKWLRGL